RSGPLRCRALGDEGTPAPDPPPQVLEPISREEGVVAGYEDDHVVAAEIDPVDVGDVHLGDRDVELGVEHVPDLPGLARGDPLADEGEDPWFRDRAEVAAAQVDPVGGVPGGSALKPGARDTLRLQDELVQLVAGEILHAYGDADRAAGVFPESLVRLEREGLEGHFGTHAVTQEVV